MGTIASVSSLPEFSTLAKCEETIRLNLEYFLEAGRALMAVRENFKAWGLKEKYGTFEEYCKTKWAMSKTHANRLIGAAGVIEDLAPIGVKPMNESQARAIATAAKECRAKIWKEAVETAPQGKVTAKHIKEVVNKVTGEVIDPDEIEVVSVSPIQPAQRAPRFKTTPNLMVTVHIFPDSDASEAVQALVEKLDRPFITALVKGLTEFLRQG